MGKHTWCCVSFLIVWLCAGTASAVVIDVVAATPTVMGSDLVAADVTLDTEGVAIVSYQFHVAYDPALLSLVSATPTPPAAFYVYGSNPESPGAIIVDGTRWSGNSVVAQPVMSLVFHVLDMPAGASATVAPYLEDYGGTDSVSNSSYQVIPVSQVFLGDGVTFHGDPIPEPATALLFACGLLALTAKARRAV